LDTELHWYEYRPAAAGVPWGVFTVHTIALAYGVFPPSKVELERLVNDLIFFKEYVNRLSWESNPDNLSRILRCKIYRKVTRDPDSTFDLLAEVDASSTGYDDRGLKSGTGFTYRITSVDESGRESPPAVVRGPK
jgi:predicted phage tail protein